MNAKETLERNLQTVVNDLEKNCGKSRPGRPA